MLKMDRSNQSFSALNDVMPVKNGECLRLFLNTAEDLQFFHDAVTGKLQSREWLAGSLEDEMEEAEASQGSTASPASDD